MFVFFAMSQEPVFDHSVMSCPRKSVTEQKVNKRLSELSISIPTRTALLQIAVLKPGNMFVSVTVVFFAVNCDANELNLVLFLVSIYHTSE